MIRARVRLWGLEAPMLVIADPAGARYFNQVGGTSCSQEELQGFLCPLDLDEAGYERLEKICGLPFLIDTASISNEVADAIDELLASKPSTAFVRVDRGRLAESYEAWVHVILEAGANAAVPLHGFGAARGVLTWPNSD
jgi:hypothetical protein